MYTAEWISSINCPGIFSLGFTFPFVNNDKDLRWSTRSLSGCFLFIFKTLHFKLLHLCRIILSRRPGFFFSQEYLMDYSLISSSLSLQFNFFCHYQIVEEQRPGVATVKRCLTAGALCGALACGSGCCGLVMVWIAWRQCCSCLCLWDYSSPDLGLVISHYRFPIKQGDPL